MLTMTSGQKQVAEWMPLPNDEIFRMLEEKENYKYLGRQEVDNKEAEIKEINNKRLYYTKEKASWRSRNFIKRLNVWLFLS